MIVFALHNNRIEYILDAVIKDRLNTSYTLTNDLEKFESYTGVKINYSECKISNSIQIFPHGLLQEESIYTQNISITRWMDLPCFFQSNGDVPFDLFAASFYLITRYEEYLDHKKDIYGRYSAQNSLAVRENFIQLSLIDLWLEEFAKLIKSNFPEFEYQKSEFKTLCSFDIDQAYHYQHHNKFRQYKKMLSALFKKGIRELIKINKIQKLKIKDPADNFDYLFDQLKVHNTQAIFFYLVSQNRHRVDANLSVNAPQLKKIIQQTALHHIIGIHPSYSSNNNLNELDEEIKCLKEIVGKPIRHSRQHFLFIKLPHTYLNIEKRGITNDYSLAYPEIPGFRASTSKSFKFFNLQNNQCSNINIHPLIMMDATFISYLKCDAEKAFQIMSPMIHQIKTTGGTFSYLFHNDYLYEGSPWRKLFENILNYSID